jgi:hypothetical protein
MMDRLGYVYIIKADTGHFKIGRTRSVPDRMKLFAVKLPFNFDIINYFLCEDMHEAEKNLHDTYHRQRVNGEWFSLVDRDIEFLKAIGYVRRIAPTDYPLPPQWLLEAGENLNQFFYHKDGQIITLDYPAPPWWTVEEYQ